MNAPTSAAPDRSPTGRLRAAWRTLPAGIWVLGFGSLFMDLSSELIHSVLPVFRVSGLGASMLTVGLIEGVAEGTAAVVKVFSGALSDALGKRKILLVLGYGLAACTKPAFPLASSVGWVLAARFVDRVGKGIRGAPRDALIADITPPLLRGAAYGLRQALDSVGAVAGPLAALGLILWFAGDLRAVMWVATVPAFITVILLIACVREPGPTRAPGKRNGLSWRDAARLPASFWLVVLLGAVFTLARFSEAFLILRAQDVGLALGYLPLVMVVMNVLYAGAAFPAGAWSDHADPRIVMSVGLALLVAADLVMAAATAPWHVLTGATLWGLHMAFTQGLLSKLVADHSPADLRGTAFGLFHLALGVALLLASVVAGLLWSAFGPAWTFLAGAAFALIATVGLLAFTWPRTPPAHVT